MPPPPDPHAAPPRKLYLLYHELRPAVTRYSYVTASADFREHVRFFAGLPASSPLLPEITFDDGHLSNLTEALPALQAHHLVARFFITAGWTATRTGFLNWPQLRELAAAGQPIGAHGFTHTLLTHCSPAELDHELRDARLLLEDGLGTAITTMSLPGGRSNQRVIEACWAAGYTQIFTSAVRSEPEPPGRLVGRLNVHGSATVAWLARLLEPNSGSLRALERRDRLKDAAKQLLGDTVYRKLWSLANREEREPGEGEGTLP